MIHRHLIQALGATLTLGCVLGIELSLDHNTSDSCGILTCQQAADPFLSRNISRITIYKQVIQPGTFNNMVVLSLSRENPHISKKSQGMNIFGQWTERTAYASLALLDASECFNAEYSCQVLFHDTSGRQWVTSSHLGTVKEVKKDNASDTDSTEGARKDFRAPHLISIIQDIVQNTEQRLDKRLEGIEETLLGNLTLMVGDLNKGHRNKDNSSTTADVISRDIVNPTESSCVCNDEIGKSGDFTKSPPHPTCKKGQGQPRDDYYVITSQDSSEFLYLCDGQTDGGGWIVIQRRQNGDVEFNRNWEDYKNGFGSFDTDFWLGNQKVHELTHGENYELKIILKIDKNSAYAQYDDFSIASESDKFRLHVEGYSGTAGDSLSYHDGMKFTTFDQDNDENYVNCANQPIGGAWWFNNCYQSNLNGKWTFGIRWDGVARRYQKVSFTEMKIRRKG